VPSSNCSEGAPVEGIRADPPPSGQDPLPVMEEASLSVGKHRTYIQRELIETLKTQIVEKGNRLDLQDAELSRLHRIELEHTRLSYASTWHSVFTLISAILVIVGGGALSIASACNALTQPYVYAGGIAGLVLAIILMVASAVIRAHLPKQAK
jgi:hypothetical protein